MGDEIEIEKRIKEILGQLAGSASLCWAETPKGVFDSTQAISFIQQATNQVMAAIQAERQRTMPSLPGTGELNIMSFEALPVTSHDTEGPKCDRRRSWKAGFIACYDWIESRMNTKRPDSGDVKGSQCDFGQNERPEGKK